MAAAIIPLVTAAVGAIGPHIPVGGLKVTITGLVSPRIATTPASTPSRRHAR